MSANHPHLAPNPPSTSVRFHASFSGVTPVNGASTAADALGAAGLDWEVVTRPSQRGRSLDRFKSPFAGEDRREGGGGEHRQMLFRQDAKGGHEVCLGPVGEGYVPLQNHEAFACFDPLLQANAAHYESAGQLGQGQTVWLLARFPTAIRVKGEDALLRYLLLANSHGGASPGVDIRLVPFRIACSNMLTLVTHLTPGKRVEHSPDVVTRLRLVAQSLSTIEQGFAEVESSFERMARVSMNGASLSDYFKRVFPEPPEDRPREEFAQVLQMRAQAGRLFDSGRGNQAPAVRGTLWAAYNGVTELIDHHVSDASPERRLQRIWFGQGYRIKARAYEVALQCLAVRPVKPIRPWAAAERPPRPARTLHLVAGEARGKTAAVLCA